MALAEPSACPQVALVVEVEIIIASGSFTINEFMAVQPLVSVTVKVCVPAHNSVAVAFVLVQPLILHQF